MGCDATNFLPTGIKAQDVEEFLHILGFRREKAAKRGNTNAAVYWHFDQDDYERFQGLSATVYAEGSVLRVDTRTLIYRNQADCDLHNNTMRHLRKRFGGYFVSDWGRNRYFPPEEKSLKDAEAGCYLAYWRFKSHLFTVHHYKMNRAYKTKPVGIASMAKLDPTIVSNNLLVPFLVSTIEDYFKSTYKSLIRFSERKASILRGLKIGGDELLDDDGSQLPVEDVIVRFMPFQNLTKLEKIFKDVNPLINLSGCLRKPYRGRKLSLFESMANLIESRHEFIHRMEFDDHLGEAEMDKVIADMEAAIRRIYEHIIQVHSWQANDQG